MGIMSGRRSRTQDKLSKKQVESAAKKNKGKKKASKAAPMPEIKEEAPKKAE